MLEKYFNIVKLVSESLKSLNIPVIEGWYDKELNKTHITFFEYLEIPENYLEDEEVSISHNIQLDIWTDNSKEGLVLKNKVKKLLKENGFYIEDSKDQFEKDIGIYHKAMRFNYIEELD